MFNHDNDNGLPDLRFLSVCSGIEAASVAWHQLGWQCIGVAEIEPFPAFVLAHHYGAGRPHFMPNPEEDGLDSKARRDRLASIKAMSRLPVDSPLPNYGDFTKIDPRQLGRVDILCGGTPCQAFSVAGLRQSLGDARGNLSLEFVRLAHELADGNGLRNVVWENVVGVLSTKDNAFGCFLGGLVGAASAIEPPARGKWGGSGLVSGPKGRAAWRIQDAQYHGLAQRRRRVLVVADFGNGADPAPVLFELAGVQRHSAPSREAGKGFAADVAPSLTASGRGVERTGDTRGQDPVIAWSIMPKNSGKDYKARQVDVAQPLMAAGPVGGNQGGDYIQQPVAFGGNRTSGPLDVATAVNAHGGPHGRLDFESETFVAQPIAYAPELARCVATREGSSQDYETTTMVAVGVTGEIIHTLKAEGADASEDGTGRGTPIVNCTHDVVGTLCAEDSPHGARGLTGLQTMLSGYIQPVAFHENQRAEVTLNDTAGALGVGGGKPGQGYPAALLGSAVRRLTPTECERLQGFPDGYTDIPWRNKPTSPDGPRYKALGNSWAVPKFTWLGRRIAMHMPQRQEVKRAA